MNVAAVVVVVKWATTPTRANGNPQALSSSQKSAFIPNVVETNVSQTAQQLQSVIR